MIDSQTGPGSGGYEAVGQSKPFYVAYSPTEQSSSVLNQFAEQLAGELPAAEIIANRHVTLFYFGYLSKILDVVPAESRGEAAATFGNFAVDVQNLLPTEGFVIAPKAAPVSFGDGEYVAMELQPTPQTVALRQEILSSFYGWLKIIGIAELDAWLGRHPQYRYLRDTRPHLTLLKSEHPIGGARFLDTWKSGLPKTLSFKPPIWVNLNSAEATHG